MVNVINLIGLASLGSVEQRLCMITTEDDDLSQSNIVLLVSQLIVEIWVSFTVNLYNHLNLKM